MAKSDRNVRKVQTQAAEKYIQETKPGNEKLKARNDKKLEKLLDKVDEDFIQRRGSGR